MTPVNLKNNIPAYLLPSNGTGAVAILVLVKVGSRYEYPEVNGVSHYIEHLMFKGTTRRPKAEDISRALDAVGAEYNAFTGKDITGYWIKVDKKHQALAVDLLHDMLTESRFVKADMDRERNVIIEEINMYHDSPMMHVDEMLESLMFDGSTLGWEIAGSHKTMTDMTRKEVINFYKQYYVPERMVVAAAGAISKDTQAMLNKTFGSIPNSKNTPSEFDVFSLPKSRRGVRASVEYKKTKQVQIALGFPAFGYNDKELAATKVLSVIMGGFMSSRLFSSVREKRGLAYFIRASVEAYEDTGLFVIQSGLDKSRLPLAGKTIMNELRDVVKNKVTSAELRRAKDYISGTTTLKMEDSSNVATWFARQQLYSGKALSQKEKLAQFEKVTSSEIQAVAAKMFDKKKMGVSGIGPFNKPLDVWKHF
ncbi:MAG: pitrilysin family protein [bacterium]|nr:pitrilysin family protein [bacterium]